MAKWFHIVRLGDEELQAALDMIIYCANPAAKLGAHITVRGPYSSLKAASEYCFDITGQRLHILGPEFFNNSNRVIYLRCAADSLRSHWWKSDFPYNPHLTLYDGPDLRLANELYESSAASRMIGTVPAGPAEIISTATLGSFALAQNGVDFHLLSQLSRQTLSHQHVLELSQGERTQILRGLCQYAGKLFRPSQRRSA
jgi:hypothetical protein